MANVVVPAVASSTRTVPDAPTNVSANDVGTSRAYDNGAATVTYTAPFNGKLPITNYVVTGNPGGSANDSGGSPTTVTGLDTSPSGTNHTFTVVAQNAIGDSASSSASASELITSVPGTPPTPTATRTNDTTVSISWTGSPNSGGKTVTGYTITSSPSLSLTYSGSDTTSPISVTGSFVANQAYTFTLKAVNANGESASSSPSNSVTPYVAVTVPGTPPTPTISRSSDTVISASWTGTIDNGGATITALEWEVTPSITSLSYNSSDVTSPVSLTGSGVVEGTSYQARFRAQNSAGWGPFSNYSSSLVWNPFDPPPAPNVTASVTNATTVSLSWTIGASDGALTSNTITANPSVSGGISYNSSDVTSPVTVTGSYASGQAYTFNLSFTSAYGPGPAGTSNSVTPNPALRLCTSVQISVACCTSTSSCGTLGAGNTCSPASGTFDEGAC